MKASEKSELGDWVRTVFGEYGRELHRYLTRRLRRAADADDLAQEVYLRLMRRNRSDAVLNPRAYVYRVASHVIAEFHSRSDQTAEHVSLDGSMLAQLEEVQGGQSSPDDMAERLSLQRQMDAALGQLPPTHRAIFTLHKRDGYSHEEIAKKLDVSVFTVEKYLVQAKARLVSLAWDR